MDKFDHTKIEKYIETTSNLKQKYKAYKAEQPTLGLETKHIKSNVYEPYDNPFSKNSILSTQPKLQSTKKPYKYETMMGDNQFVTPFISYDITTTVKPEFNYNKQPENDIIQPFTFTKTSRMSKMIKQIPDDKGNQDPKFKRSFFSKEMIDTPTFQIPSFMKEGFEDTPSWMFRL